MTTVSSRLGGDVPVRSPEVAARPLLAGPAPREPLLVMEPTEILVPAWGAFIGYLGSVSRRARVNLWRIGRRRDATAPAWASTCIQCGYPIMVGLRCPECGEPEPGAVGGVYFHRLHARLARRRRIDPVRAAHAGLVAVLLFWPLIAGLAGA